MIASSDKAAPPEDSIFQIGGDYETALTGRRFFQERT